MCFDLLLLSGYCMFQVLHDSAPALAVAATSNTEPLGREHCTRNQTARNN